LRENETMSAVTSENLPDTHGHFGPYGGRYVPETLMHPLQELEAEYFRARHDPDFQKELSCHLMEFVGRPTPLYFTERPTKELGDGLIGSQRTPRQA
jgi:tryptophan synthase beta chain